RAGCPRVGGHATTRQLVARGGPHICRYRLRDHVHASGSRATFACGDRCLDRVVPRGLKRVGAENSDSTFGAVTRVIGVSGGGGSFAGRGPVLCLLVVAAAAPAPAAGAQASGRPASRRLSCVMAVSRTLSSSRRAVICCRSRVSSRCGRLRSLTPA